MKPYQRIDVHERTLIFMSDEILDRGYEKEFKSLKEMTEAEWEEIQKEIEGKAGRKNEKTVPQKKVETIVQDRIKDRNNKRFIHQNGKYKGRANVNQIYKYIEENHYTLAKNLSERRMKTRIKKALPKDMK